jgi:hypothetical protein
MGTEESAHHVAVKRAADIMHAISRGDWNADSSQVYLMTFLTSALGDVQLFGLTRASPMP